MVELATWTLSLTPGHATFVFSLSALASFFSIVFGFYYLRQRRIFQDTPTSKIRSASQGFVEIEGMAKELGALRSPGLKKDCVWFRYVVEKQTGTDKKWAVVHKETSPYSFYIDDGTGICAVDPQEARVIPKRKKTWTHGEYRYTEQSINLRDQVYCVGQFETEMGPSRAKVVKEGARLLLNEWKQNRELLLSRFDLNGDGEIDLEEWGKAREAAREQLRREVAEDYEPTQHHVLVKPFSSKNPFIVSCYSEEQLTGRYRWYSLALFIAFFLTGGYAVFMVAIRGSWLV